MNILRRIERLEENFGNHGADKDSLDRRANLKTLSDVELRTIVGQGFGTDPLPPDHPLSSVLDKQLATIARRSIEGRTR